MGIFKTLIFWRTQRIFFPILSKNREKTLIIGSGGGRDIAIAMVGGSAKIVAVELNPLIVEAVKSYGAATGNVYDNEKVQGGD